VVIELKATSNLHNLFILRADRIAYVNVQIHRSGVHARYTDASPQLGDTSQKRFPRTPFFWGACEFTIRELIGSVNTSAFYKGESQ